MSTAIPTLKRNEPIVKRPAPASPAAPVVKKAPDPHRVQSNALNEWRIARTRVRIVTGAREHPGVISAFDQFTVLLDGGTLIFKHAIHSIAPMEGQP